MNFTETFSMWTYYYDLSQSLGKTWESINKLNKFYDKSNSVILSYSVTWLLTLVVIPLEEQKFLIFTWSKTCSISSGWCDSVDWALPLTKVSLVWFPVRTHARVAGQVPSRGHVRGNHILMFLFLSISLPSPVPKNKYNIFKNILNNQ